MYIWLCSSMFLVTGLHTSCILCCTTQTFSGKRNLCPFLHESGSVLWCTQWNAISVACGLIVNMSFETSLYLPRYLSLHKTLYLFSISSWSDGIRSKTSRSRSHSPRRSRSPRRSHSRSRSPSITPPRRGKRCFHVIIYNMSAVCGSNIRQAPNMPA